MPSRPSEAARHATTSTNMTPQEADKFAKYFADPTFCKMFADVARDMSDPQARAEQNAFIAQLEAQGELEGVYGRGVQAVQAEPGFVVKTKTADGSMRVYINLCTSPKIEEMKLETVAGDRPGAHMTLPHMLSCSADRVGTSENGQPFKAWDYIVHPNTLTTCVAKPTLLDNLLMMAMEGFEKAAQVKLLRKYKFVAVKYKGVSGEQRPPALLLRTTGEGEVVDGRLRPVSHPSMSATSAAAAAAAEPAAGDTASCKDGAQHTYSSRSAPASRFAFATTKSSSSSSSKDCAKAAAAATVPADGGLCTPQYQVVERARVDLTSAWSDAGRGLQGNSSAPEALVVRVELPGISSAAGVQLDLAADSVMLEVPGKYKLQLPLRHKIDTQRASAKFLVPKQLMVLILPVVPPPATQQPCQPHQQPGQQEGQQLVTEVPLVQDLQQTERSGETLQQPGTASSQVPDPQPQTLGHCDDAIVQGQAAGAAELGDAVPEATSSPTAGSSSKGAVAAASDHIEPSSVPEALLSSSAPQATQASKTANQLRWEELHSQAVSEQGSGTACAPDQPDTQQQPEQAQQQERQPQQTTATKALWPRLSSRRVSAADFV